MLFELLPDSRILSLVDCNNFYVSCERVFNPSLNGKPVVVLSNNDGCAIARSNEAKALGIGMGEPFFKWRRLVQAQNVRVFSANFALYGDMSRRVMLTLQRFCPELEVYSIDEAFMCFEGNKIDDYAVFARDVRRTVFKHTGLPVSVGIARTKTLAKIANRVAKKVSGQNGVCVLLEDAAIRGCLSKTPVGDIWGIGQKKAFWLNQKGIVTAEQFCQADKQMIRKVLGVVSLRTLYELRGISCQGVEPEAAARQSMATTRTFGEEIHDKAQLEGVVSSFAALVAQRMREQGSAAGAMQVVVQTNPFKPGYYSNAASITFSPALSYTPRLLSAALGLLGRIYRPGLSYKRAGVILMGLVDAPVPEVTLYDGFVDHARQERLMAVVDCLGRNVFWARERPGNSLHLKQSHRSGRWTSRWDELLTV